MTITRREVLAGAGKMASSLAVGIPTANAMSEMQAAQQPAGSKLKVVVTGGHPGDPEYGCGGTIARYTALGHEVVLLYLNDGAYKSIPASVRIPEAKKACEILKARPVWAGQVTSHAVVDNAHYEQWAAILDAEKPDVVFTQWPIDNHADHRATVNLTYGAWIQTGKKFSLYYYEVSDGDDTLQYSPTHYINITEQESTKRAACYAHASATPDRFYPLQDQVATFRGIEGGYKRAEAFILQMQSPKDPLRELQQG
jgi:LmbE family N-acetylglucosaminyl deacetylase